ncbi:MAG: VWA domain-containing protein [Lentisphaerae bacterium]|nr:VWA domain-containing protein [Lentisphaerota bacterium]
MRSGAWLRCVVVAALACMAAMTNATPVMPDGMFVAGAMYARGAERAGGGLFLPLRKTDVALEMTGAILRARVVQRFVNDTAYPLEAVYVFPLPARAAVTGMELRVGDRVIRSVVKEREQAKAVYEKAKEEGKKAALVEQERPNIFTTSVANFMPGETVDIALEYTETAEYAAGAYGVTFPMVVGQRYVPFAERTAADGSVSAEPAVADAGRLNPPLLGPGIASAHALSLELVIRGVPVKDVVSNTHGIRTARQDGAVRVTLDPPETAPNCEFHASVRLMESESPELGIVRSSGAVGRDHVLATVFPPTVQPGERVPAVDRDVIFLVDTSGSMSGESIGQAKAGLAACVRMLRTNDCFTIARFASDYSLFTPDLRPATADRLEAARAYVESLSADGGTEMQPALEHVLSLRRRPGAMGLVVFITDGCVGNEDSLMKLLGGKLGNARLFTFGIGSAPNEFLVRKMGELGRGQARFIRSHEDIGAVMSDFFRTLDRPVLTDVSVAWIGGRAGGETKVECYPARCADVFDGRPLQIIARLPEGFEGRLVVNGRRAGGPTVFELDLPGPGGGSHAAVDALFGSEKINELMTELATGADDAARAKIAGEVLSVALDYQLVSRYTSRVAVEERVERYPDGSLKTVNVPVPAPRGWTGFQATATDDLLRALAGAAAALGGAVVAGFAALRRGKCAFNARCF